MRWPPESRTLRALILGVAVLLGIAAVTGAGWAWYSARESRARLAFAEATDLAQQSQSPDAPPEARDRAIKALEAAIAEHPSSSALPEAAYWLGNLRYGAGQYAGARGAYELALAKGASGSLRTLVSLGIAYTWESEKNYAKAEAAYQAALAGQGPKDFLYEELLIDLGRVQETRGEREPALATYQRLLKELPESRRGDNVRSRIAALESAAAKP